MGAKESTCLHTAPNTKLSILTNNFNHCRASFRLFPKGETLHNSLNNRSTENAAITKSFK